MPHSPWDTTFHLQPRDGWLNDPNGLCQMDGTYFMYYQYAPGWPADDLKHWGLATSKDLLTWKDGGVPLSPSIAADADGVYSGCALVERGAAPEGRSLMRVFYTGNVVDQSVYPRVDSGRESNQLLVESTDGVHFGEKAVLLRNGDYPASCTLHVRDPKVWEQDGRLLMLLGARERGSVQTDDPALREDVGVALIFESADRGQSWQLAREVRPTNADGSPARLGYMWECPNICMVGGREFLAVCPQGLPEEELRWQNLWQAGYLPVPSGQRLSCVESLDVETFVEWDHGFDFYAPQVFEDEGDRQILVGWMGTFDERYTSTPEGMDRAHCMTLPRRLSLRANGLIRQWPVGELEARRQASLPLEGTAELAILRADVVLDGIAAEQGGELWLNDALCIFADPEAQTMGLRFAEAEQNLEGVGAGRTERRISLTSLSSLRVIVDGSTVEAYANDGAEVFSTRWFPREEALSVRNSFAATSACAFPLA